MSDDYDELYKQAVKAYNKADFKTSYNHFLTVANGKYRIADDAKFYLAKQYEMELMPVVAKNYNTTFGLYEQVSKSESKFKYKAKNWLALYYDKNNDYQKVFELYLDIYIGKPDKFNGTNLLLAERIKNNRGVFTDKKKKNQKIIQIKELFIVQVKGLFRSKDYSGQKIILIKVILG